jgi:hypothetical protein
MGKLKYNVCLNNLYYLQSFEKQHSNTDYQYFNKKIPSRVEKYFSKFTTDITRMRYQIRQV